MVTATPLATPVPTASASPRPVLWTVGCGAPTNPGCACQRNLEYCEQGVLARSDDLGDTWSRTFFDTGLGSVDFPTAMNGWAVGAGGFVVRTTDGGRTWQQKTDGIQVPPEATARGLYAFNTVRFLDARHGIIAGWGLTDEVIGRFGPSLLYRPELFVLRTADGGETWAPASIVGDSSATDDLYDEGTFASSACFTVDGLGLIAGNPTLLTHDGGLTWENISDRTGLAAGAWSTSCGEGGRLWLSVDRSVVRSDDGGDSWTLINDPETLPYSFVSQMSFLTNEMGWRSGTDIRRTEDGGRTWNAVGAGLPSGFGAISVRFATPDDGLWTSVGIGGVTHDGGATWRMVNVVPLDEGLFALSDLALAALDTTTATNSRDR